MKKTTIISITLVLAIVALFFANLAWGSVSIPLREVLSILAHPGVDMTPADSYYPNETIESMSHYIVMESRLPNAITALLAGAALATSGLLLQTAFRNPLAGPDVFGISSGAALAVAVVMLAFGGNISIAGFSIGGFLSLDGLTIGGFLAILISAFAGAMLVMGIITLFSAMVRNQVVLLIIGIMVGYLASSGISLLNFFSSAEGMKSYMIWGMGNMGNVSMAEVPYFATVTLIGLLLSLLLVKPLISSGAALAVAVVMLAFGGNISIAGFSIGGFLSLDGLTIGGFLAILISAFAGAMLVMGIITLFSAMVRNQVVLLIIGIMVGYLASSGISLLNFFSSAEGMKSYMIWGMGNMGNVSMAEVPYFATVTLIGLLLSLLLVKPLNALLLGEQYAENLGFNIRRLRILLLVVTGLLTAVVTAFCGPIAFIGLATPHIVRLLIRTDNHRQLLPLTMLMGSVIALLCNALCVLPAGGGIIPLNAVTPLFGAPVIIYVLVKRR
jgi:iron complex transport system permease protein